MTTTTGVTLTGDNNDSGFYATGVEVLGGQIYGNTTTTDAPSTISSPLNETFLFGDLQHKSTIIGSGDIDNGGTYNTTATGSSGDTLIFSFHLDGTQETHTSNFLDVAPDHQVDTDDVGAVNDYSSANINGWESSYLTWVDSLTGSHFAADPNNATEYNSALSSALDAAQNAGWDLTDLLKVETGAGGQDKDSSSNPDSSDPIWQGHVSASEQVSVVTGFDAESAGNKILLGFSVGSDHIGLGGDSAVTNAQFDQYFTVNSDSHISANNNVVNDTVISLGTFTDSATVTHAGDFAYGTSAGGWSVDLYGVDIATLQAGAAAANGGAGESLKDYVYETIVSHA